MENKTTQQNNFTDQILNKIKSGEVSMKPKYYFVIKLFALGISTFLIFILSSVLVSYVLFSIKASGQLYLLDFGPRGVYRFLMALPWIILVLDLLLIVFIDWLLKSFRFGYNSSVAFLFVVTMVSITALATCINYTSFHKMLLVRAENKDLPFGGGFYEGMRKSHGRQGIYHGEIVSIESTSTFYIKYKDFDFDIDNDLVRVEVPDGYDVFTLFLAPGDKVFVAGDKNELGISAFGVRKLTPGI